MTPAEDRMGQARESAATPETLYLNLLKKRLTREPRACLR